MFYGSSEAYEGDPSSHTAQLIQYPTEHIIPTKYFPTLSLGTHWLTFPHFGTDIKGYLSECST